MLSDEDETKNDDKEDTGCYYSDKKPMSTHGERTTMSQTCFYRNKIRDMCGSQTTGLSQTEFLEEEEKE